MKIYFSKLEHDIYAVATTSSFAGGAEVESCFSCKTISMWQGDAMYALIRP